MSVFESILYGLISGLSEFIPVSSQGHQAILLRLFGLQQREPFCDLLVHIAILFALLFACRPVLAKMRSDRSISSRRKKNRNVSRAAFDSKLIRTAAFPLSAGILFYIATSTYEKSPLIISLLFLINGVVLIIPEYIRHGNKDARFMTGFDGILIGLLGALSVFPGISRIGIMNGYALARGADRNRALNWLLCLSIPVLILFAGMDIYGLIIYGFGAFSFMTFLGALLSGISAFIGGYLGIIIVRNLTVRSGFAGFAYYSWGAAIFAFILYLIA